MPFRFPFRWGVAPVAVAVVPDAPPPPPTPEPGPPPRGWVKIGTDRVAVFGPPHCDPDVTWSKLPCP